MDDAQKKVINEVIYEKVQSNESFTSVDIANEVKRRGVWIQNKIVAQHLRDDYKDNGGVRWYAQTLVTLPDKSGRTFVYHPYSVDVSEYKGLGQKAITPDEFNQICLEKNTADIEEKLEELQELMDARDKLLEKCKKVLDF